MPAQEERLAAHRVRMEKKRRGEAWSGQREKRELKAVKKEKRTKRKEWMKKQRVGGPNPEPEEGEPRVDQAESAGGDERSSATARRVKKVVDAGGEDDMAAEYTELRREKKVRRVDTGVVGTFDDL